MLKQFLLAFRLLESALATASLFLGTVFFSLIFSFDYSFFFSTLGFRFVLGSTCLMLSIYAFNLFLGFDEDIDNPRFYYLKGLRKSVFLWGAFLAFFLSQCLLYSTVYFFLSLSLFLGWGVYAFPKWRIKYRPIFGGGLHFILGFFLFFWGWHIGDDAFEQFSLFFFLATFFSGLFLAGYFWHLSIDFDSDEVVLMRRGWNCILIQNISNLIFFIIFAYWVVLWRWEVISDALFYPIFWGGALQILGWIFYFRCHENLFLYRRYYRFLFFSSVVGAILLSKV